MERTPWGLSTSTAAGALAASRDPSPDSVATPEGNAVPTSTVEDYLKAVYSLTAGIGADDLEAYGGKVTVTVPLQRRN